MSVEKETDNVTASVLCKSDAELKPGPVPGNEPTRPMKTVPVKTNLNTIKFMLTSAERRQRRACVFSAVLLQTHVGKRKKRGTVTPGNGGGSPFCQRGQRRLNDESQNVMLTV